MGIGCNRKAATMNKADENDLLGQVREALGADPKEGIVAAARRVKADNALLEDRGTERWRQREEWETRCKTAEAAHSSANQVILQQLDEVKELRAEIESSRRKLQTIASAVGFGNFGSGDDVMGALFEMRRQADRAKAAEEALADEVGKRVEADAMVLAANRAAGDYLKSRDEWKARAEKAEATLVPEIMVRGEMMSIQTLRDNLLEFGSMLAEEKRKREEAEMRHDEEAQRANSLAATLRKIVRCGDDEEPIRKSRLRDLLDVENKVGELATILEWLGKQVPIPF